MMTVYGYARASITDPELSAQTTALMSAGCENIRTEKASTAKRRVTLQALLGLVLAGDMIVVTRFDRLARSITDLAAIARTLDDRGVTLRIIEPPIDTSSAAGRSLLQMLGAFSEFEARLRHERKLEASGRAKVVGVYPSKGRPATISAEKVKALSAVGKGPTAIAHELKISRMSVHRVLNSKDV